MTRPDPSAPAWSRIAREVIGTPYPWSSGHLITGPDDTTLVPERLHPAFHGSLDWHSCVHMLWSLTRLVEGYADVLGAEETAAAVSVLDERLTPGAIAVEVDYLRARPGFERPYGWAWAALLCASVATSPVPAASAWRGATAPLLDHLRGAVLAWLPQQAYPVRHGKHQNDAFALTLLIEAFGQVGDEEVVEACRGAAERWFAGDVAAPTSWEPSGTDFLSPALTEAVLMRRVLGEGFTGWLEEFLPGLGEDGSEHGHLLEVPEVRDDSDGQYAHLRGLALSRAWALRELADVLEGVVGGAERAARLRAGADKQEAAVLDHIVAGDFMATHWLVSFALLARGELGGCRRSLA